MADLRKDTAFATAVAGARAAIDMLHRKYGISDATALYERAKGKNNLSGHAHSIIPLAVLIGRVNPSLLAVIRGRTNLRQSMSGSSSEVRDRYVWSKAMAATKLLINERGNDIISDELSTTRTQSIRDVATTYLSDRFGGGQTTGGAGDTVIKRTLKLLAHIQYE